MQSTSKEVVCELCSLIFPSKRKLFLHLEKDHGYDNPNSKPHKAVILFGWISQTRNDNLVWVKEGEVCVDPQNESIENFLFNAISAVSTLSEIELLTICLENIDDKVKRFNLPKLPFSRSSSNSQKSCNYIGMEQSNHCLCDTLCIQIKKYISEPSDSWVQKVNKLLPKHIRVLDIMMLPSAAYDFHAETYCSQRRYEFLLPLDVIMPPDIAEVPTVPIVRQRDRYKQKKSDTIRNQTTASASPSLSPSPAVKQDDTHHNDLNETTDGDNDVTSVNHDPNETETETQTETDERMFSIMDKEFPIDTKEGQTRIAYFRKLKPFVKVFQGRYCLHNFVTGGSCPDDSPSMRKIDRIYHKEIFNLNNQCWALFSISGDVFMKGQVARLAGIILGKCCQVKD